MNIGMKFRLKMLELKLEFLNFIHRIVHRESTRNMAGRIERQLCELTSTFYSYHSKDKKHHQKIGCSVWHIKSKVSDLEDKIRHLNVRLDDIAAWKRKGAK